MVSLNPSWWNWGSGDDGEEEEASPRYVSINSSKAFGLSACGDIPWVERAACSNYTSEINLVKI